MPDNKPITRPRPRSTPTCARWLSKTTIALAIAATLVGAQLQPGPYDSAALTRDPDLNDVLECAVWPAGPGAPPPDGYDLLLERARRQVRFEERAEQEAREKRQRDQQLQRLQELQQRPDLASPGDDAELGIQDPGRLSRSGSVRVVRETFYVPLDGSLGGGEADPNVARVDEGAAKGNASEVLPETPADFRQTVGRLRSEQKEELPYSRKLVLTPFLLQSFARSSPGRSITPSASCSPTSSLRSSPSSGRSSSAS